jgi:uncharacterized membrane protein HdeD (DUF308 family)
MYLVLKLLCLGTYALGLASAAGWLPESWGILATIAAVLLASHVVELLVMFKHVRRYRGSLAMSAFLTILFGLLHWLPLARAAETEPHTS